jgi:hypothetical protein
MNVPGGDVACPLSFEPQQATLESVRIPHAKLRPTLSAMNLRGGGARFPEHETVESLRIPHV